MKFPSEKMSFLKTCNGEESREGFLVLDISALDLDGVDQLYIDLSEISGLKTRRKKENDALERAKKLLGS